MIRFLLNYKVVVVMSLMLFSLSGNAQRKISLEEYIETYKDVAMDHMREYGIPASIKLAQGILETGFGNSNLAVHANNHFGIKCHGWQGRTFYQDDDRRNECFRAYDNPMQSFIDHSEFLTGRARYAPLFELEIMDYKRWAQGLRKAGYATNPRYPQLLIGIIERNSLYEYDKLAMQQPRIARDRSRRESTTRDTRPRIEPTDEFAEVGIGRDKHENNRIRYIYAQRGDTPESIASELDMRAREIYRYNEMERGAALVPGQIVYLQPKRRRGTQSYHITQSGEKLYDISQKYGVRMRSLYWRNRVEEGFEPSVGERIYLRGRAPKD